MEYLEKNLEWLEEVVEDLGEDPYVIFDLPGQIELYSHLPVMNRVMEMLRRLDFQCCGVYLIDASFTLDSAKLMSGMLAALSAMIKLEVAHINVLSKCDLVVSRVAFHHRRLSSVAGAGDRRLSHLCLFLLELSFSTHLTLYRHPRARVTFHGGHFWALLGWVGSGPCSKPRSSLDHNRTKQPWRRY